MDRGDVRRAHEQHAVMLTRRDGKILELCDCGELLTKLKPLALLEVHKHERRDAHAGGLEIERRGEPCNYSAVFERFVALVGVGARDIEFFREGRNRETAI